MALAVTWGESFCGADLLCLSDGCDSLVSSVDDLTAELICSSSSVEGFIGLPLDVANFLVSQVTAMRPGPFFVFKN